MEPRVELRRAIRRRTRSRWRGPTRRIDPKRIECGPAAFVAAIPPTVQKAPLDGSTGNRKPCLRAARIHLGAQRARSSLTIARCYVDTRDVAPSAEVDDRPLADRAAGHAAARTPRDQRQRALFRPTREERQVVDVAGTATALGTLRAMPAASA